ncbi:MAG: vWA domain-containing protein [Caldilineaceae bacterium]
MPYTAEISRANPGYFIILLDQSGSMNDPFGGEKQGSKADALAAAINRILQELVIKCSKDVSVYRYFAVSIIGYGASVGPVLGGALAGQPLAWIDDIYANPLRVDEVNRKVSDGAGGLIETKVAMPIWFDPVANNGTPMAQAFQFALTLAQNWVAEHPASFPPIVINVTDGEPTDADPTPIAEKIKALQGQDGNALVMNVHASSSRAPANLFPADDAALPDQYAKMLFNMSSELPSGMRESASDLGYKLNAGSRAFVFNSGLEDLIQFLIIGTRPSTLR